MINTKLTIALLVFVTLAMNAHGQTSERVAPLFPFVNQPSVDVGVFADIDDTRDPPPGSVKSASNTGEVFAAAGQNTTASGNGGFASAQGAGTAASLTPLGSTTGVPTVDADFSVQLLGQADDGRDAFANLTSEGSLSDGSGTLSEAVSLSDFELQGPDAQYLLHGTLHLAAAGIRMGDAEIGDVLGTGFGTTFITARIGVWNVVAEYVGNDTWDIDGFLPGGIIINETTTSLNKYYNFSTPVAVDTIRTYEGRVFMEGGAYAFGSNTFDGNGLTSSLNYVFSGSAWSTATPLGQSPVLGDVDGDGDSDIDDYVIVIQGQGIGQENGFGATLADGDTNQDGIVNATDVQNVLDSSGLSLPSDADLDSGIDGIDFLAWQRGFGTSPNAQVGDGDADGNGTVDSADLALWELGYGFTLPSPPVTAVPEPSSILLLAAMLSITCHSREEGTPLKIWNKRVF